MSQKSRNQGFSYYICLMIEGSAFIPLTSGSGSGRPKNMWIRWIRIRIRIRILNTGSNISRCFFLTKMCIPFLLLISLANCAHPLSTCLASKNGVLYSEGRSYKKAPELVTSPQSTALHSTGNISAEDSVYKNKVGHNSTCGIVSPLLFF